MQYVTLEKPRPHIAVLTLNRPERYNALSFAVLKDIHAALDEISGDLKTRVLIITGAGKGFCAGADLKEGISSGQKWSEDLGVIQDKYQMQQAFGSLPVKIRQIPQPVIAAVNGPAAGGGLAIALASDIRICTTTAKFNAAFIRIGIGAADMAVSYFLPKAVGPALAAELMYTGRFVEPDEAQRTGLVSRVVEPEKLMETALSLAGEMVANASPFGLRITKEALNLVQGGLSLEEAVHLENRNQVLALQTQDFMQAAAAWMQKKTPEYKDR